MFNSVWRFVVSVSAFRINEEDDSFELGFEIPIAREKFFIKFWQVAIDELGITEIKNGIDLKNEHLSSTLHELEQLRNWAESNLQNNDLNYIVSRINLLMRELPTAFKTEHTTLWIG
ncbi:hypothetical protein [Paenibacillus sp. WLX2291]|uniref:hypothetical protein n=1 Tax=Paenibacillus sp. WLX2291 TaxID=3296934 RepID=UPI003984135B